MSLRRLIHWIVNIPELVAHTQMDAESVSILRDALQDCLKSVAPLAYATSKSSLTIY